VHDQRSRATLDDIRRAFGRPIEELPADPEKLDAQLQAVAQAS
jgi:hypothetical protein